MKNIFGHNIFMLPFQGANRNNRQLAQGVAVGVGYKWFSTIRIRQLTRNIAVGLGYIAQILCRLARIINAFDVQQMVENHLYHNPMATPWVTKRKRI